MKKIRPKRNIGMLLILFVFVNAFPHMAMADPPGFFYDGSDHTFDNGADTLSEDEDVEKTKRSDNMADGSIRVIPSSVIKSGFLTEDRDYDKNDHGISAKKQIFSSEARSLANNSYEYFYTQLSAKAKTVYDAILDNSNRDKLKNNGKIVVWGSDAFTFRNTPTDPETGEDPDWN